MSGPTLGAHLKAPTGLPIPAPWPSVLRILNLFQCTPSLEALYFLCGKQFLTIFLKVLIL